MADIPIPREALEAMRKAYRDTWGVNSDERFTAAATAMLKAWPGMIVGNSLFDGEPMVFLPVPEPANG